jgi:copper(I)-binding protein
VTRFTFAVLASVLAGGALAGDITVEDPYARSSNPKVGAAFMMIKNAADTPDRLIGAQFDNAARVELHTHIDVNGVMRMIEVEDGIPVPANGTAMLKRGGDHVMLMGLSTPIADGDEITVTLEFENAGEVVVSMPVDNARKAAKHVGH